MLCLTDRSVIYSGTVLTQQWNARPAPPVSPSRQCSVARDFYPGREHAKMYLGAIVPAALRHKPIGDDVALF
jgi:hypothetical protein